MYIVDYAKLTLGCTTKRAGWKITCLLAAARNGEEHHLQTLMADSMRTRPKPLCAHVVIETDRAFSW